MYIKDKVKAFAVLVAAFAFLIAASCVFSLCAIGISQ